MMRAPAFWARERQSAQSVLLAPAAALWGALAARRMKRVRVKPPAPTICVGNFVVGGAGKTPVAAYLHDRLRQMGLAPAIVCRGYRGSLSGREPVVVDPLCHDAAQVGDEAYMLARRGAMVVIGADRAASIVMACNVGARSIVMDDGFQTVPLLFASVLVADAPAGLGNGRVLPAGPLRAPLPAQWSNASALVLIDEGAPGERLEQEARRRGLPVFHAALAADENAARELQGRRVLAFAGIGRPEKFFHTLEQTGADVVARRSFPDHHAYRPGDLARLERLAREWDAEVLVTTEKDMARLAHLGNAAAERFRALPVEVELRESAAVSAWLEHALDACSI